MILSILFGIFLGSIGLAWMHHLVHKFRLYSTSICWKYHKLHHSANDPEFAMKQNTDIMSYSIKRFFVYMNFKEWTLLDWGLFMACLAIPKLGLSVTIGLFMTCNIEYLQHDYNNYPVDFTNKFDNWIGLNFGKHTEHHGKRTVKHEVTTEFYVGMVAMYTWLVICVILYPALLLNPVKPNNPGVYKYGLFTNLANYKAMNGISFQKLMYRMPSLFDKPKILIQYIRLIFGMENETELSELSHDVSQIRNIYMYRTDLPMNGIKTFNGKVIEGHHRYMASKVRKVK